MPIQRREPEDLQGQAGRDAVAVLLALALFALYFVTYGAHFESSDAASIYSVAESIAKRGDFDSGPFIWERWTGGESAQGEFGLDGRLYSKKGLTASLLAAGFVWLAMRVPGIGLVDTAYLLNPIVTAITGAVVFLFALRLGYRRTTAVAAGLLYGLATLAWPYSAYLYPEPLGALLTLLSALFAVGYARERRPAFALGAGLAAGWATITRFTNLPLVVLCAAYAFLPDLLGALGGGRFDRLSTSDGSPASGPGSAPGRRVRGDLAAFAGAAAACLWIVVAYNLVRFGDPFRSGYPPGSSGFWTPLGEGLYGLLFSPAKGLFLFAPVLILAPPSLVWFLKRHPRDGLLLLALAGVQAITFAKWMDWEGGLSWGPRFLVNIVPLLIVMSLPLLEWLLGRRSPWWAKAAAGLLAAWSVAVQAVAAGLHFGHYLRVVRALADGWQGLPWAVSPPIVPFVFTPRVLTPDLWQPAWVRHLEGGAAVAAAPLTAALGGVVVTGALLAVTVFRRPSARVTRLAAIAGVAAMLALVGANLQAYRNANQDAGDDYVRLVERLETEARRGDALLLSNHMYMGFLMNRSRAPVEWYALLSKEPDPSPAETALLERVASAHRRVWLVIDRTPALSLPRPAEKWLTENAFKLQEWTFSEYCRLALFDTEGGQPSDEAFQRVDATLGSAVRLRGYRLVEDPDGARLSLLWESLGPVAADFTVFVQVLDAGGALVWQSDRPPADGFRPTSAWRPGDRVRDNYLIPIRLEAPGGKVRLVAGMYDPLTLERLPVTDADQRPLGDHVALGRPDLRAAE